jgi:hypothetical protein
MNNPYQKTLSHKEINDQLLTGLKRHLPIAQDTTTKKDNRLGSLRNLEEVLEYVVGDINAAVGEAERAILQRFFDLLLQQIKYAIIDIHSKLVSFAEEIAFINIILKMR